MSQRRGVLLGWVLVLLLITAFVGLGGWQLARMHEKQAMSDAAATVLAERQARPLAAASDSQRRRDYDWAEGEGQFVDIPAILLDNQSRQGRPGVRVYRLFQAQEGAHLLVELGWLPVAGDRRMPMIAPIPGARRIAGLLMPPPARGLVAANVQAQPDGTILTTTVEAAIVATRLGHNRLEHDRLPPRILRLDPALQLGYVRDLDILPNTLPPQRHLGYAVQWFALAAAVLVTALLLTFRKPRPFR